MKYNNIEHFSIFSDTLKNYLCHYANVVRVKKRESLSSSDMIMLKKVAYPHLLAFKSNFFVIIMLLCYVSSFGFGKIFYVDDDAKDLGGSGKYQTLCGPTGASLDNKLTIQAAINAANIGDIISICDGSYRENLKISKNALTIKSHSADRSKVIIESSSIDTIELTNVNGFILESLTLKQTHNKAGILINSNSQNILIKDIVIESNKDGIDFNDVVNGGISIEHVTINSTDVGIYFRNNVYGNCTLDDITITSSNRGIYFEGTNIQPIIKNSHIISSGNDGIYTRSGDLTKFTLKDSCVTTQKDTSFALSLDINGSNSVVTGNCFYAKATNALAHAKKEGNTFSANYWDGKSGSYTLNNISDTSPLSSCPKSCGLATPIANYHFAAWDTFRSINDRNISTKIVSNEFYLTIVSLDESGTQSQDFNGTVCVQIVDENNVSISGGDWISVNPIFNSGRNSSSVHFTITKAAKKVIPMLAWNKDSSSTTCPISSTEEDNRTLASDFFAVRPSQFFITPTNTTVKAGEDFNVSFTAGLDMTHPAQNYNENSTPGGSVELIAKDKKSTCTTGYFTPNIQTDVTFINGNKAFYNINYDDVGVLDINISEVNTCANKYASVDCDDKNIIGHWTTDENLSIRPNITSLTIHPHHFNVAVQSSNAVNASFTYLASDYKDFMHAIVDLNITAQNKQNNTTKNYTDSCYAKNIDLSFHYSGVDPNLINFLYQLKHKNITLYDGDSIINKGVNYNLTKSAFSSDTNGSSILEILYNFQRDRLKPINPFAINITDFNVSDSTINGNGHDTTHATFYYGRVKTKDIRTEKTPINHNLDVEVYSQTALPAFHQNSVNWYMMGEDNATTVTMFPKKGFTVTTTEDKVTNTNAKIKLGKIDFDIANTWDTSNSAYVHLEIPQYLWNSRYSDYNASGDCSMHPCFKYEYVLGMGSVDIGSGDFNGTTIGSEYQATKIKKRLKIFR